MAIRPGSTEQSIKHLVEDEGTGEGDRAHASFGRMRQCINIVGIERSDHRGPVPDSRFETRKNEKNSIPRSMVGGLPEHTISH